MTTKQFSKSGKPASGALSMAKLADRHELYEYAVQDPPTEYEFITTNFRRMRGRLPAIAREDFCGTAAMSCEWVRQRRTNIAIGVDLDPEVLGWAQDHNAAKLTPGQRERLSLVNGNVLTAKTPPADVALAMNFSYFIFRERATMRRYFRRVRDALVDDGIFFLDAFGGYEAFREMSEKTDFDHFSYIWDQAEYDPVTGRMQCYIHFRFPDGSRLRNAFSYEWRLWTLPEIRELLEEAGFSKVTVYWQGTDEETNEGNGEFTPAEKGDADPAWICLISAEK